MCNYLISFLNQEEVYQQKKIRSKQFFQSSNMFLECYSASIEYILNGEIEDENNIFLNKRLVEYKYFTKLNKISLQILLFTLIIAFIIYSSFIQNILKHPFHINLYIPSNLFCYATTILIILKFVSITDENNLAELWLYVAVIHSLIALIQYKVIEKYLNKYSISLSLAVEMELVNVIAIEQGLNQEQQQLQIQEQNDYQNQQLIGRLLLFDQRNIFVSKVSQELYEKLQDKFKCLKIVNKLLVIAFFFIELCALMILFDSSSIFVLDILFYYLCMIYMILVVLIGINQYCSTFALVFLWIVFSPVFISYEIYKWCKRRKEKRIEKKKILNNFEEILFDQKKHQMENNDCAICMQYFQEKEKVIFLSCSDKHVFHTDCIVDWLKLNSNCPLCRKQVQSFQFKIFIIDEI